MIQLNTKFSWFIIVELNTLLDRLFRLLLGIRWFRRIRRIWFRWCRLFILLLIRFCVLVINRFNVVSVGFIFILLFFNTGISFKNILFVFPHRGRIRFIFAGLFPQTPSRWWLWSFYIIFFYWALIIIIIVFLILLIIVISKTGIRSTSVG